MRRRPPRPPRTRPPNLRRKAEPRSLAPPLRRDAEKAKGKEKGRTHRALPGRMELYATSTQRRASAHALIASTSIAQVHPNGPPAGAAPAEVGAQARQARKERTRRDEASPNPQSVTRRSVPTANPHADSLPKATASTGTNASGHTLKPRRQPRLKRNEVAPRNVKARRVNGVAPHPLLAASRLRRASCRRHVITWLP